MALIYHKGEGFDVDQELAAVDTFNGRQWVLDYLLDGQNSWDTLDGSFKFGEPMTIYYEPTGKFSQHPIDYVSIAEVELNFNRVRRKSVLKALEIIHNKRHRENFLDTYRDALDCVVDYAEEKIKYHLKRRIKDYAEHTLNGTLPNHAWYQPQHFEDEIVYHDVKDRWFLGVDINAHERTRAALEPVMARYFTPNMEKLLRKQAHYPSSIRPLLSYGFTNPACGYTALDVVIALDAIGHIDIFGEVLTSMMKPTEFITQWRNCGFHQRLSSDMKTKLYHYFVRVVDRDIRKLSGVDKKRLSNQLINGILLEDNAKVIHYTSNASWKLLNQMSDDVIYDKQHAHPSVRRVFDFTTLDLQAIVRWLTLPLDHFEAFFHYVYMTNASFCQLKEVVGKAFVEQDLDPSFTQDLKERLLMIEKRMIYHPQDHNIVVKE